MLLPFFELPSLARAEPAAAIVARVMREARDAATSAVRALERT